MPPLMKLNILGETLHRWTISHVCKHGQLEKEDQIWKWITSLVLHGMQCIPPLMKLSVMGEAPVLVNHPPCMDAWTSWRRWSILKGIASLVLRSTALASLNKAEHHGRSPYMDETSAMYGSMDASEKWFRCYKGYFIGSLKYITHASLDEVECYGRSPYMDESSTMYESVGTFKKTIIF